MSFISLEQDQYEALVALARKGAVAPEGARALETFLIDLEKRSGVHRYLLWVQWQELGQPLPQGTDFPTQWPPEMRARIDLISRPVSRADVQAVLAAQALQPTNVLVTRDPGALVGWTQLDAFFLP